MHNRSIGNSDRRNRAAAGSTYGCFAKIKDLGVFDIAGLVGMFFNGYYGSFLWDDITGYAGCVMNIGTDECIIPDSEDGAYTQTIDGMQVLVPDLGAESAISSADPVSRR